MDTTLKSTSLSEAHIKPLSQRILTGVVTGQIAGLIMAVVMMLVFTVFLGKGPLYPVQVIGSILFGEDALQGFHFGAFVAGLFLHQLGPSLLWGVLYGLLAKKFEPQTPSAALFLGLGIGVIAMIGPYFLIPALMHALQGVDIWNREVPMFWDWAAHFVFGASFALYPIIERKIKSS